MSATVLLNKDTVDDKIDIISGQIALVLILDLLKHSAQTVFFSIRKFKTITAAKKSFRYFYLSQTGPAPKTCQSVDR